MFLLSVSVAKLASRPPNGLIVKNLQVCACSFYKSINVISSNENTHCVASATTQVQIRFLALP